MKNKKQVSAGTSNYLCLILFCIGLLFAACNGNKSTATKESLYYFAKLDSTLNQSAHNRKIFDNRMAELTQKCTTAQSVDAVYFYQKLMAEAYMEMEPDTALIFISKNLDLALREKRQDWEAECYIYQAQTYNSAGLIDEARKVLNTAQNYPMTRELKLNYYMEEMGYWNNRAIQLDTPMPDPHAVIYADSIMQLEPATDSPYHVYAKTWFVTDEKAKKDLQQELMDYVDKMNTGDIWYDKISDCAGTISYVLGDIENEIKYYTLSNISKINKVSRHLPMVASLGGLARDLGELKYAARFYNAAIRVQSDHPEYVYNGRAGLGNSVMQFHNAVSERLEEENRQISLLNYGILTLMMLSLILLFYTILQLRKRISLNQELEKSHKELSENEQKLLTTNLALSAQEKELNEMNVQLLEANYLKEEYIGQLFATCSDYLNKVETLKKSVNRKLRAGQYAEATKQTDITEVRDNEDLHELWKKFDEVFLKLFPDFIEQFNGLLRPEERITLRPGEKLNTDLRIYALVRLGINNSVKIGKILGISSQTVYNARMKMRGRATESELEFPVRVRQLKGTTLTVESSEQD